MHVIKRNIIALMFGFQKKILLLLAMSVPYFGHSQNKVDSVIKSKIQEPGTIINKLYSDAKNSVFINPNENNNSVAKSEIAFSQFEGKVIRKIDVLHYGYENVGDTSTSLGFVTYELKRYLHTETKQKIIRQNLFIKEKTALQAAKLADNERYLRSLDFIQDARIFIKPFSEDSVDVIVVTKDLFSFNIVIEAGGLSSLKTKFAESNFMGLGQKLQTTILFDQTRTPKAGYELLYNKNNIGGSFMNGTVAYTQINTGKSEGLEDEFAYFIKLDRPLVSPFAHVAGAFEISYNRSENVYKKTPPEFLNYNYHITDCWVGYNVGTTGNRENYYFSKNRNRFFLSCRYYNIDFKTVPDFVGNNFDPIYNDKKLLLTQVTVFREDFYKLHYIYGFGATEDVPKGYNFSITGGITRQLFLERPYFGFHIEKFWLNSKGAFIDGVLKASSYFRNGQWEDAGILTGFNYYTRIYPIKQWKHRELFKVNFAALYNRITYEPLRIDNVYGLHEFNTDSVQGITRLSFSGETVLYSNRRLLGFHTAFFAQAGVAFLHPENLVFNQIDGYSGIGCGLRMRNDNLVFGTIELHGIYFPRTVYPVGNFVLTLQTDLRYRFKSNFVQAPDIVQFNAGNW